MREKYQGAVDDPSTPLDRKMSEKLKMKRIIDRCENNVEDWTTKELTCPTLWT